MELDDRFSEKTMGRMLCLLTFWKNVTEKRKIWNAVNFWGRSRLHL